MSLETLHQTVRDEAQIAEINTTKPFAAWLPANLQITCLRIKTKLDNDFEWRMQTVKVTEKLRGETVKHW